MIGPIRDHRLRTDGVRMRQAAPRFREFGPASPTVPRPVGDLAAMAPEGLSCGGEFTAPAISAIAQADRRAGFPSDIGPGDRPAEARAGCGGTGVADRHIARAGPFTR
ncbi:hypothetical protein [Nocardia nova]|uniref:hypothetical protein n=1 Tax=Nocardia nova TaxID=37330 RepID=UPI0007A41EEE|nr:hypothetical protein [Nocardia nova]